MKPCYYCGQLTDQPVRDTLRHLAIYQEGQWKYLSGNVRTFGFWSGLAGTICLVSPLINALVHWKYRKFQLDFQGEKESLTVDDDQKGDAA